MEYTKQSLPFRLRKVLRYARLYGPSRTRIKVRGRYHMKKRYAVLPPLSAALPAGGHVAMIGCGNFAFSTLAYYLRRHFGNVLRATMDIDIHRAASLYEEFGARYYTDDAASIFADPAIDLAFIASNHASHAEYAIRALAAGKSAHVEKPHVVSMDQLVRLCRALGTSKGRISLGFNRPHSRIGEKIKAALDAQHGPAVYSWFIAGHDIPPDHWYHREEEGGRVLGNLCHWTDFVYQLVPPALRYPITITPTPCTNPDSDIAVTFLFGDGTVASLTFSAKGHLFEGVRETFLAHRADALISMSDFKDLTIEVVERRTRHKALFRDHGHEARVVRSYQMARPEQQASSSAELSYVWETGELFLRTDEALRRNEPIVVHPFEASRLAG